MSIDLFYIDNDFDDTGDYTLWSDEKDNEYKVYEDGSVYIRKVNDKFFTEFTDDIELVFND